MRHMFRLVLLLGLFLASATTTAMAKDDLWSEIVSQYELSHRLEEPSVQQWMQWYSSRPYHMQQLQARAAMWLAYVFEQVQLHDMPAELALLPAVESAFNPTATSSGGAAGLWQIMPNTGRHLGLEQSWWIDTRQDVPMSTRAALEYLRYLHGRFGDWMLAVAAYNAGEGSVSKALRRNRQAGKPLDFFSLQLPKETQHYVPKLLALAAIIQNPRRHQVRLLKLSEKPGFEIVPVYGQLDLIQAAELSGVSEKVLRQFNPGLKHAVTPPDGPHRLLVPGKKAVKRMATALRKLPDNQRIRWSHYLVKKDDNWTSIAHRHNTSRTLIQNINQLKRADLAQGQTLLIANDRTFLKYYPKVDAKASSKPLARKSAAASAALETKVYKVKAGDSLWTIARSHDLHIKQIEDWNGISRRKPLRLGQALTLKLPVLPASATHKVVAGDNLWDLARQYNTTVNQLKKWNGLSSKRPLQLGQVLKVSAAPSKGYIQLLGDKPEATKKMSYSVRSGDSLDAIANRFGVTVAQLCDWNQLNPRRYLMPGQSLILHVHATASASGA